MAVPHLTTALRGPILELEKRILEAMPAIEHWLRGKWQQHSIPFYCSVDLRNSGFKLAPVDTNLFPGGFNNLNTDFLPLCVQAMMAADIAEEAAKQDAADKKAAEEEAAKTPEDRFNETKEVALTGSTASVVKDNIEPILTTVFGKVKPVLFSGGYMGQEGSFLASFKIPSVPTSEDFNKLTEEFTSDGYKVVMNSVTADSGNLMLQKDDITISISYESPEDQEIGVLYVKEAASE